MTTATPQFGRRSAGAALRGPAKPDVWASQDAAAALGAATGWNRSAGQPTLASLPAAERSPDEWTPRAPTATAGAAIAPPPSLMALLFSANGRIRRRDYWLIGSGAMVICILAVIALAVSLSLQLAALCAVPVVLAYGRIRACLKIKRWHDRDKGAIWSLIAFAPMVGSLWAFVECGFLEGTPGPNRFGLSPK